MFSAHILNNMLFFRDMLINYKKPIIKTAASNVCKENVKNSHISTFRSTLAQVCSIFQLKNKKLAQFLTKFVIFPQWLATIANSMLFLGVGMMVASPTVVIGVLHKSKGELSLDDEEASWFGN